MQETKKTIASKTKTETVTRKEVKPVEDKKIPESAAEVKSEPKKKAAPITAQKPEKKPAPAKEVAAEPAKKSEKKPAPAKEAAPEPKQTEKPAAKSPDKKGTKKTSAKKAPAKKNAGGKKTVASASGGKDRKKSDVKKSVSKSRGSVRSASTALSLARKVNFVLQCSAKPEGISYNQLITNAKNVWRYDLNGKVSDIKEIQLYVKPEEGKVYYVINSDTTGAFDI